MRDLDEFDKIFEQINRILGGGFSGGYTTSYPSDIYKSKDVDDNYMSRTLNIFNYDDKVTFTAELTGLLDEDLKVTPEKDSLTVEAFIDGEWIRRKYSLPESVRKDSAKITFKNNVLDVELEKISGSIKNDDG